MNGNDVGEGSFGLWVTKNVLPAVGHKINNMEENEGSELRLD